MSAFNFSVGFLLGFGALAWMRSGVGHIRYSTRLVHVVRLVAYLLSELIISNFQVARDIITPRHLSRPGIIKFELESRTDAEITVFTNIISFMPGTVSIDISDDHRTLYLHVMFLDDRAAFSRRLRERIERPLLEVLRR